MKEVGLSTLLWSVQIENVKNLTTSALIDLIRFTSNVISRVKFSKQLNLTQAAIMAVLLERCSSTTGVVV